MKKFAIALTGLSFLAGGQAFAADYQMEPLSFTQGQFYGQLGLGYGMINDIDISSGTISGITVTGSGTWEFSGGIAATGILGYQLNDFLAFEAQLAYNQSEYDQVSGNATLNNGVNVVALNGSLDVDGDINLLTGFGNVIVSPFQMDMINPYIGGGIGFAHVETDINSVGGTVFNYTDDYTKLAATAIAGVDFMLQENFSAGARYQFVWADTGNDIYDDATGHSFFLTGKLHF